MSDSQPSFVKFTCVIKGELVSVDINTETHFISDAWMPSNPDWQPNGEQRKEVIRQFKIYQIQNNKP